VTDSGAKKSLPPARDYRATLGIIFCQEWGGCVKEVELIAYTMPSHEHFLPLFLAAQHDLRAFIGSVVRDPVVREDVFQEVSLVLWKSFSKFDSTRSFGAWARGIAIRKIMESRREIARLPLGITDEALERVSEAFELSRDMQAHAKKERALQQCLEQLPPRSSSLISERYGKGKAGDDLARELGLSLDAVYQMLSRIRRLLRDCVTRKLSASDA
jgi:RNA polymerase sigma-70 factor, ECF subfamily